ncbi:hypothetical protein MNAN1_003388 [Malassezia nana]|uniref:FMR1-interacting protein 1 conserved domain-containing protein n=1 Tax=Malassezia nana TaxID=180528 RepID=A0AAF0ENM9_9BASI|nr:hypothetical protein MNAN1_003388 [Malassezia nana]
MAEGPPPRARRPKKVPRYDEYGNYLGDVREDELAHAEAAAAEPPAPPTQPSSSSSLPPPPPTPVARAEPSRPLYPSVRPPLPVASAMRGSMPRSSGPLLYCGLDTTLLSRPSRCTFSTSSELELMLHRADRHLVYPPGGMEELRRRDPMRVSEERERLAQMRKGGTRAADGPPDSTILGLNIKLDTPELIEEWIRQRKKRFPTAALVAQKQARIQRRATPRSLSSEAGSHAPSRDPQPPSSPRPAASAQHARTSSSSSSSSDSDSDSDSDMDPVRDAVSTTCTPSKQFCQAHPPPTLASDDGRPRRRARPRRAAPHPFEVPDLLRRLLEREILQHVDALAQWLDFVLDNDFLSCVERERGEAAAQRARRSRVTDLSEDAPAPPTDAPLVSALASVASPPLRALDELHWPDEPDPLIYLDPLRATDPQPLRHSELEMLAMDPTLRSLLQPADALHPHGETNRPLRRALETWQALPTPRHREAALQLILGVGVDSPMHAHEAYAPAYQRVPCNKGV